MSTVSTCALPVPICVKIRGAVVARFHLVTVVHARGERLADLGQRAPTLKPNPTSVLLERSTLAPSITRWVKGFTTGTRRCSDTRRKAHVEAQAQGEPIRELVADGGIDGETLSSSAFWETNRPLKVSGLAQDVVRPNGVCRPIPKTMRSLKGCV